MAYIIPQIEILTEQFRKFPGIGRKTAQRMAFSLLEFSNEDVEAFANALVESKRAIKECSNCSNISCDDICSICSDPERRNDLIYVVEDTKALMSIERVREFKGTYHVLHGTISPMNGVGPDKLKIKELLERVASGKVKEVILATNPTADGETTAMYITKLLKPYGVKVSLLASGLPAGGDLEYADELTLHRALEGRREV